MNPTTYRPFPYASSNSFLNTFFTKKKIILLSVIVIGIYLLFSHAPTTTFCPTKPSLPSPPTLVPIPAKTNVFITGGAGYIGTHMVLLLLEQQEVYNIVVIDDLSRGDMRNVNRIKEIADKKTDRSYIFVKGDCGDIELVTGLLKKHQIDIVIHFAGFAYASESVAHPLRYFDNIVVKTQNLLTAMNAASIRRLLYSSSSATYGQPLNEACDVPIAENSPQIPVSPYGRSKLMAEQIIEAYHYSQTKVMHQPFSYVALRYFNVIGADRDRRVGPLPKKHLKQWSRIVDACFDAAIANKPMILYGNDYPTEDGTAIRDYIHVSDLVAAHLKVMQAVHDDIALPYNVGIGHGFSNKQLAEACSKAVGRQVVVQYGPRRAGDPALVLGDATRMRKELKWTPEYNDLTEMLLTAWKWRELIEAEETGGVKS